MQIMCESLPNTRSSREAVLGHTRAKQGNFCFRGSDPAVFLLECSNLDVALTLGWFTGLRLAVALVLGQNACKQRPVVWLLRSVQVALVSGGKLSTPCQVADHGGLRQAGKARQSSQKQITEGATTELHSRWGIKPHPPKTAVTRVANLYRDRLKATATQGTEMVKQACLNPDLEGQEQVF